MNRQSEDDAWRAIVENFGERADVDAEPEPEPEPPAPVAAGPGDFPPERPEDEAGAGAGAGAGDMLETGYSDDDTFVPPPPPPIPHVPLPRLASWLGLLGSPTLLLICLIAGISLPSWLGYLLVGGFVAGFAYLVIHMPRDRQDPWDDGAVL